MIAVRPEKIPSTSVRRRISLFNPLGDYSTRSWRQVCFGKLVNASRSLRRIQVGGDFQQFLGQCVEHPTIWAATDSGSTWSKTEWIRVRTQGHDVFGQILIRLRV